MKVYIQSDKNNIPKNVNFMNAYQGFFEMGFEIVHYQTTAQLRDSNREDVIVGGIGAVKSRLYDFGITAPDIDYPQELNKYLGRKVCLRGQKMNAVLTGEMTEGQQCRLNMAEIF